MTLPNKGGSGKRRYEAPRRDAAARRTRLEIVRAAKGLFESRGWAATTVPAIAAAAGVSPKTVEAAFGTKAALLETALTFAIRGDLQPTPMPRRPQVAAMEAAADAAAMLDLHARHVRAVNGRSAAIAWAVEQAAGADARVGALWRTMNDNRRFGARWATRTLLTKPGAATALSAREIESVFLVGLAWETYRLLTVHGRQTPAAFERWLRRSYDVLLAAT